MKNRSTIDWIGYLTLFIWAGAIVFQWQPALAATVTLSWDANVPTPDGYRVYQRVEGQTYDFTLPVCPSDGSSHVETTCTIDGLVEGVTYYYVVRAYLASDESGDSNEVQYQPAPTNLAVSVDDTTVTDSGTGGTVEPTPEQVSDGTIVAPTVEDTTVADTTVTDSGTDRSYDLPPTVTLSWDANAPAPDGYRVYQRVEGQTYDYASPVCQSDGGGDVGTTCTIDGLAEGVTYYFVVRAYLGSDESGDSNEVQYQPAGTILSAGVDETSVTDSGTSETVEPTPEQVSDGTIVEPTVDDTTVTDTTVTDTTVTDTTVTDTTVTDSGYDLPTPVQPVYGDSYPASLEIFDNTYAHQSWLSIQWREDVPADTQSRIAMGDIDGDGRDEMVIGLGRDFDALLPGGLFQIVDDDASLLGWGQIDWPDYNLANGEIYPSCGDIDGDGDDEILLGLGVGGQGMVEVLDFQNGSLVHLKWITVDWPEYNDALGQTHPAAGDIDNDGADEIIIGLGGVESDPQVPGGLFQVLDDDLSMLAWGEIGWLEYNQSSGESYPACGDLNGDGKEAILIGLGPGGGGKVATFQYDANVVTQTGWMTVDWDTYNQTVGQTRPACGDVDGDGREEILIGLGANPSDPSIPGGRFPILNDDATLITWAQIQWPEYNAVNGESFPVAGDINADGIDDIFVGLGTQTAPAIDESQTTTDTTTDSTVTKGNSKNKDPSTTKGNSNKWK